MNAPIATPELQRQDLFREHCPIGNLWIDADDGRRLAVHNPATGQCIGHVPSLGAAETTRAIDAAAAALPEWRARPAKERARLLRRWYDLLMAHQEDLARLMTLEEGKPLAESRAEIAYAAGFIEWFGEEAKRVYGDTIPGHAADVRIRVIKQPVGVCAAITPWNFPAAMIARKVGPALATGCTIVVKPASSTPFSALALAVLAQEAGIPPGVLSVVTGSSSAIGPVLTGDTRVRKLSFTGSTDTGRRLMADCAPDLKRLSMELGGNAPFIVFDDADLDSAVSGAIACKFRNSGQTCVCANRILVQSGIHDRFVAAFVDAVRALKVGDGLDPDVKLGPLIDADALDKVDAHVDDARSQGATTALEGGRSGEGLFYRPTVLTGIRPGMRVMKEETFGPLAPIVRFESEDEAIRLANDTEVGLAAYFYTRDLARSHRVAEALEYGIVGLNTGLISTEVAPFGGVKQSGYGREGSKYGIDEYLDIKYLCTGGIR